MIVTNKITGEDVTKYVIAYLEDLITKDIPELNNKFFISLYNEDKLGGMIRNLDYWLDENFKKLVI